MSCIWKVCLLLAVLQLSYEVCTAKDKPKDEEEEEDKYAKLKKKKIEDYTEADLERLYEQWEEDEEPLPEDELPPWQRPKQGIDMSKLDMSNPEKMMQQTKKGQTLMMFASVSDNPSKKETEEITQIWQQGLFNANYEIQRYVVGDDRVLFMIQDGSKAWEIKDFLVAQERCDYVTIDNQDYPGKGYSGINEVKKKEAKEKADKQREKEARQKKREEKEKARKEKEEQEKAEKEKAEGQKPSDEL